VPIKTPIDATLASIDVVTQYLTVITTCIIKLSVSMVVVGLELGDTQQFLFAVPLKVIKVLQQTTQCPALIV
jgi:hypothetical protein